MCGHDDQAVNVEMGGEPPCGKVERVRRIRNDDAAVHRDQRVEHRWVSKKNPLQLSRLNPNRLRSSLERPVLGTECGNWIEVGGFSPSDDIVQHRVTLAFAVEE
jgi:hypothetical protein